MTESTYNAISTLLGIAAIVALVAMVVSLIAMIVRWKSPKRRGHLARMLLSLTAIPILIGTQQAMLWLVYLPALGEHQRAQVNAARAAQLAETTLVKVGDAIPETTLRTIDGDAITLPEPGRVVLVNFFATWCAPCEEELPQLQNIWLERRDNDHFQLVVIGREETAEAVRSFREKHGFSFPMAADPDREIYSLFAKKLIPRTFVVSSQGQVVYSKAGYDETDIAVLNAVLNEQLAALK